MWDALRDVGTGLVSSLLFGLLTYYFNKWRQVAAVQVVQPVAGGQPTPSYTAVPETKNELLERRREADRFSVKVLFLASCSWIVPILLGGGILGTLDSNGSSFITDRMRSEADYGYVQYWLGFSILAVTEILWLLLRPWRGRAFGVGMGIALAVFLLVFGIPASRGIRIF